MTLAESLFRHLVCMCLLYFQYDDTYGMHKKKKMLVYVLIVFVCVQSFTEPYCILRVQWLLYLGVLRQ